MTNEADKDNVAKLISPQLAREHDAGSASATATWLLPKEEELTGQGSGLIFGSTRDPMTCLPLFMATRRKSGRKA